MPRILLLITLAETGGAQTYVASLLPALAPRFDVVVAAHGDGPLRAAAHASGARFVSLRHVRREVHPLRDLRGVAELVALMRRERPQIVHCNSSKAGVLGRVAATLARVPVRIFTAHGWAFAAHRGAASALYRWADRLMAPLTTVTICVAQAELRAGLAARTCRAQRSVVIPNAVDVLGAPRAALAGEPPRLASVGRLAAPKDPLTLVRALARLPAGSFTAVVAGDGPLRDAVEAEARALGVAVDLAGARDDVAALLAASDLFVLSSRSEGAPLSVLEAMAAGLPVVACDVGGIREQVVDGGTGLLVPPGDPALLAAAIGRLLGDPQLRRRLGAAGRHRGEERFDVAAQRRAHVDLYARELARCGIPASIP